MASPPKAATANAGPREQNPSPTIAHLPRPPPRPPRRRRGVLTPSPLTSASCAAHTRPPSSQPAGRPPRTSHPAPSSTEEPRRLPSSDLGMRPQIPAPSPTPQRPNQPQCKEPTRREAAAAPEAAALASHAGDPVAAEIDADPHRAPGEKPPHYLWQWGPPPPWQSGRRRRQGEVRPRPSNFDSLPPARLQHRLSPRIPIEQPRPPSAPLPPFVAAVRSPC
ncbi:hypothetical protein BRADI_2g58991v3 [Brachypodium distachyon]|uniref:Uncharacterized protein n=1 Tax=Brachypodium distachyon TaxID=15368 RepID=A0A0Q3N3K2_BRADI|nr:hypothetical protein BRADI_2g58991v3 [Brachypodium distachyon]